ncbi:hypothetical protein INR49_018213 [Caranx melampygus]|nr:hypothetical protein INR49_018213 [Caranx melampygus]
MKLRNVYGEKFRYKHKSEHSEIPTGDVWEEPRIFVMAVSLRLDDVFEIPWKIRYGFEILAEEGDGKPPMDDLCLDPKSWIKITFYPPEHIQSWISITDYHTPV